MAEDNRVALIDEINSITAKKIKVAVTDLGNLNQISVRNHNDLQSRDAADAHPNLTQITTRNHNDLQNLNPAGGAHKAEAVGVSSPPSINPNDIGKNWKSLGASGGTGNSYTLKSLNLGGGRVMYADNGGNIILSFDYGNTWSAFNALPGEIINAIEYCGNGICLAGTNGGNIYRSTNHGLTWNLITNLAGNIITITYLGNSICTASTGTTKKIFRSTDNGLTWVDLGVTSPTLFADAVYTDNGILLVRNGVGTVYRSTDFGLTYVPIQATSTVSNNGIEYLGNGIVVAGDNTSHVYRSTDYGLTWTDIGSVTSSQTSRCIANCGNGVVILALGTIGNPHLLRSTDYGLTWTDIGAIPTGERARGLSYVSNGVLVLFDTLGNVFRSDIAYKKDESQVNYPRIRTDVTTSRALNTTYTNSDPTRTLHVIATVRSAITVAAGNAYVQGKAEKSVGDPTAVASGIVGIQAGLLNEDNSFQIDFYVMPGEKYRIDSSATNGTVTLGKWFETFI